MRHFKYFLSFFIIIMFSSICIASISMDERNALIDLYFYTNGASWINNSNWRGEMGTECSWHGISCNSEQNKVTKISLGGNNLNGTIPSTIGTFSELTDLNLCDNKISGHIPVEIGSLTKLIHLNLYNSKR